MRGIVAVGAMLAGLCFGSAAAQEAVRVELAAPFTSTCSWQDWTSTKAMTSSVEALIPPSEEEREVYQTVTRFLHEGEDLLIADMVQGYPQGTVYLRFDAHGVLHSAAYDQDSLEAFAQATQAGPALRDEEAVLMGGGYYEPLVHNRTWRVGDPLYTAAQLEAVPAEINAMIAPFDLIMRVQSDTVFTGVTQDTTGRELLTFSGPIRVFGGSDPAGDANMARTLGAVAQGVSVSGQVEVTVSFDRATGHLVSLRELTHVTMTAGDELGVRVSQRLTGDCRQAAGE